ncbi:hypothetical protein ACT7DH_10995 [Bacillus pacificus]
MSVIFSGIQPIGTITLGNYLGAMKQFTELQNERDCYFCIVNQRTITVPQDPVGLRRNIPVLLHFMLACGIDPEKLRYLYNQKYRHTLIYGWIMQSVAYVGN